MVFKVRLARAEEADRVHQVMRQAFSQYEGNLQPPSGANRETVEEVAQAISEGGAVLALEEEKPIGSARFKLDPDHMYVGRVSVIPDYRYKGVASAMMNFIEEIARWEGQNLIRVTVRNSLPGNVKLYLSLGYEIVDEQLHPSGLDTVLNLVKGAR